MARDWHILVSGRWDNDVAVVKLRDALEPANWGTSRAVLSRPRVTPDVVVGGHTVRACGLPVSLVAAPHLGQLFVVNHTGVATPDAAARMPHGHAGTVAVLDLAKVLDPANGGGLGALVTTTPLRAGGPVDCALTPDGRHLLVTSSEGEETEDGGFLILALETSTGEVVHRYPLPRSGQPSDRPSPNPAFGGFPNPSGIAMTAACGGLVVTANGGSDDVTIARLTQVLGQEPAVDPIRIPVECGPFGVDVSPDGLLLAVANRESAQTGDEGGSITLVDLKAALEAPEKAVIGHVAVGGSRTSRPMGVAFSPDDAALFVTCFRTGTLSRLDRSDADGSSWPERRVTLTSGDGRDACPRGVHVTADGCFVLVAGGARGESGSSSLWVCDPATLELLGHVRGVGNESYLLTSVSA